MRRAGIAALALLVALLGTPAAQAGERIDRAGQALAVAPLYVEPDAAGLLRAEMQATLADRLAASRTPIYVAVLADATLAEVRGDPSQLTAELQRATGDRPGTYAVVVGNTFAAGSTVIGRSAAAIADAVAAREADPGRRVIAFVDEVERAAMRLSADAPGEPGRSDGRGSGIPTAWVIVGLGVFVLGGAMFGRRRRSSHDLDDLRPIRATIDEDIASYGAALGRLDAHHRVSAADRTGTADFGRAHGAYERAKQAAKLVRHVRDARSVTAALEEGWYALACAHAHRTGQPTPERRPPCLFDPRHGPAAAQVAWLPADAEVRAVPACRADAARLAAGHAPQARIVRFAHGRRPYWEAGPSYAPWAEGWYDAHNPLQLATLLWGTPLGDAWDDPAMATAESPFDGWSDKD